MNYDIIAQKLIENADDEAIVLELLKEFALLSDQDKEQVIVYILGALSRARELAGYGPKAAGAK